MELEIKLIYRKDEKDSKEYVDFEVDNKIVDGATICINSEIENLPEKYSKILTEIANIFDSTEEEIEFKFNTNFEESNELEGVSYEVMSGYFDTFQLEVNKIFEEYKDL